MIFGEFNSNPRQTCLARERGTGDIHWFYRAEGLHWQADLFVEARLFHNQPEPGGELLYAYFDSLQQLHPRMVEAVNIEEYWPKKRRDVDLEVPESAFVLPPYSLSSHEKLTGQPQWYG